MLEAASVFDRMLTPRQTKVQDISSGFRILLLYLTFLCLKNEESVNAVAEETITSTKH